METEIVSNRERNLRFRIVFAEENLRWLSTDPDTEETRACRAFNVNAIREAEFELAQIQKKQVS